MESLGEEDWNVVISGTSLTQSLLALALSKCDVKVLHVDQNDYYGGIDAGLSLDEIQRWVDRNKDTNLQPEFVKHEESSGLLGPSRSYTITLNPQIIYAKSRFLPALVSSQIHTQLEFQAVGSFYVLDNGNLTKIPSNREDVFADDSLSVRDKRKLMNLLRYVVDEHDDVVPEEDATLKVTLQDRFKLSQNLNGPVQALSLTTDTLDKTSFSVTASRLKRHFMSMGCFGPGLAAVMAKYGGSSEIAQVACRAGAVGGFVYLLGQGISSINQYDKDVDRIQVKLSDGIEVKTKYLVGSLSDLPSTQTSMSTPEPATDIQVLHRISIISNPMKHLFVPAVENGAVPAVAVILADPSGGQLPPVYIQVHSEDTGECPTGNCVLYASTINHTSDSQVQVQNAVSALLTTAGEDAPVQVLWTLSYVSRSLRSGWVPVESAYRGNEKVIVLPERSHDLALDDSVLDHVKAAWTTILGKRSLEYDFLQFEERREPNDDDDED